MVERRQSVRLPADAIVMYQSDKYPVTEDIDEYKIDTPLSINLSAGGLEIRTTEKLKVGMNLQIVLAVSEPKIPMQIKGKVIWVKDTAEKDVYLMGIKFTDFDKSENKDILENYMKACLTPNK